MMVASAARALKDGAGAGSGGPRGRITGPAGRVPRCNGL